MITTEPEEPEIGCLQTLVAYCLTAYLFMSGFNLPNDGEENWYWILLAPILFPLLMLVGLIAGGNSEVPVHPVGVIGMGFIFLVAWGAMTLLMQQALKRRWLAWTIGGIWVAYLVYALSKSL